MDQRSNFEFLKHHDELLFRLANTAEQCFVPDPNTTLVKVRQLGEALAQSIAARLGVEHGRDVKQIDLLRNLEYKLSLDEPEEQLLARIQEVIPKPKSKVKKKAKPINKEA